MEKTALESKVFLGLLLIFSLTGMIGQFVISFLETPLSKSQFILQFFSYFTILTNSLIAIYAFTLFFLPDSRLGRRFSRQHYSASLALHIFVVGLIYNTILRFTWSPTGFQMIVDELLHLVVPLLYILYWAVFVPKTHLRYTSFFPWLIYPLLYITIIMTIATRTQFYPYPFINVNDLGWNAVSINIVLITVMYIILSLIMIGLTKLLRKSR